MFLVKKKKTGAGGGRGWCGKVKKFRSKPGTLLSPPHRPDSVCPSLESLQFRTMDTGPKLATGTFTILLKKGREHGCLSAGYKWGFYLGNCLLALGKDLEVDLSLTWWQPSWDWDGVPSWAYRGKESG